MICDVDAYPISVEAANWSRLDGGNLDDVRFVKDFTTGSAKLMINGIRREDTGEYTCVADNGVGRPVSNTTMILVKRKSFLENDFIKISFFFQRHPFWITVRFIRKPERRWEATAN